MKGLRLALIPEPYKTMVLTKAKELKAEGKSDAEIGKLAMSVIPEDVKKQCIEDYNALNALKQSIVKEHEAPRRS